MTPLYEFRRAMQCNDRTGKTKNCVEVATNVPDFVAVRDGKTGSVQEYSVAEWADFLAGAKAGEFDV